MECIYTYTHTYIIKIQIYYIFKINYIKLCINYVYIKIKCMFCLNKSSNVT